MLLTEPTRGLPRRRPRGTDERLHRCLRRRPLCGALDLFDELRLRMGGISSKEWIRLALNEWIGMPSGVAELGPEK